MSYHLSSCFIVLHNVVHFLFVSNIKSQCNYAATIFICVFDDVFCKLRNSRMTFLSVSQPVIYIFNFTCEQHFHFPLPFKLEKFLRG